MDHSRGIGLWGCVAIIFFSIGGGPFGMEPALALAGPLFFAVALLSGVLLWNVPLSMVVLELSTAFPQNGGYILWSQNAYGESSAIIHTFLSWSSGVAENAASVSVVFDTLRIFAKLPNMVWYHTWMAHAGVLAVLAVPLMLGIKGMTRSLISVAFFVLSVFVSLIIIGLPHVNGEVLMQHKPQQQLQWMPLFHLVIWSLDGWDSVSTMSGEIASAHITLPKAILLTNMLVPFIYLLPVAVGVSVGPQWSEWTEGTWIVVAQAAGGSTLATLMMLATILSKGACYTASVASDAFLFDAGTPQATPHAWAPEVLTTRKRPRWCVCCSKEGDIPMYGVGTQLMGQLVLLLLPFLSIVKVRNFIQGANVALQLGAFLTLRHSRPTLSRPFTVPGGRLAVLAVVSPMIVVIVAMCSVEMWLQMVGLLYIIVGLMVMLITKSKAAKQNRRKSKDEIFAIISPSSLQAKAKQPIQRQQVPAAGAPGMDATV